MNNKRYNDRMLREMIKSAKITTEEKIYKGKRYQMLNCGGKYFNIGVCLDNNATNEEKK